MGRLVGWRLGGRWVAVGFGCFRGVVWPMFDGRMAPTIAACDWGSGRKVWCLNEWVWGEGGAG